MSTKEDPLTNVLQAHQATLDTQHAMREAAALRDQAVRDAVAAGYTTADIASHIGVSRRRVQAMAGLNTKQGEK